ncbi:MAG: hypothetical protein IPI73_29150 [Betaproteobacteria bacterium]|nr:hypothetical protein [Betaproteobacteria bacterium]
MNAARNVTATFTLNPPAGSGWIPANRICPTAEGDDSLGAFALPNGQLAAASAKGISVQGAGLPFPPPAAFTQAAYVNAGWFHVRAVIRPDSSGIIAWPTIGTVSVQDRAADGTYTGTRQVISGSGNFMLGMDGANNATLAYWKQVTGNELHVITRAAGATSFADPIGQTVATAVALDLRGLVVDPDGAAVVVWQEAGALKQAVRAAGAGSFGAPATIQAANVGGTTQYAGPTVGANAAGRAVLAFYDIVTLQYRAAIREPGGAFGAPVDLGAGRIFGVARTAVAVAQDGNAAVLADSYGPETACPMGTYWPSAAFGSILRFSVASGSTSWTTDGAIGGGSGSNAVWGTLAGGAGSRIEASWWQDPATLQVLCDGSERTLQLVAGTLGGSMTTVYNDSLLPKGQPSTYNRIPVPSSVMDSMALNACGDGVLVFSINPVNNFGELPATAINDGIYVASTKGCP